MLARWAGPLALAWTTLTWLVPAVADAEAEDGDKSQFNLLNPTPRDRLRPLDAATRDVTESPYTVDAGHLQVESTLVGYSRNESGSKGTNEWVALGTNLRLGLTNDLDAELQFAAYRRVEEAPPSPVSEGFGDLALRLKGNLWGNDPEPGERTAAGWIVALTLPTGTDLSGDHVQGAVFLPVAWHAASWVDTQAMLQFDFVYDEDGRDYDSDLVHSAEATFPLGEHFETYLEYLGVVALEGSNPYRAQLGSGLTYLIGENAAIDVGAQAGLTNAAPVVTTSLIVTFRF
jgi:hypothetical protein